MARAYASSVINAPIERVWARIRDFNGLPSWHPAIKASTIEGGGPASEVGCVRAMTLADDGKIRERLLALSDVDTYYTYVILDSPLPVRNYQATLRLRPIADGSRTYAEWTAHFDPDPVEQQAATIEFVGQGVFQGGFNALKEHFGG